MISAYTGSLIGVLGYSTCDVGLGYVRMDAVQDEKPCLPIMWRVSQNPDPSGHKTHTLYRDQEGILGRLDVFQELHMLQISTPLAKA